MGKSSVDARTVKKEAGQEQETLTAEVNVDVAIALPMFPEEEYQDIKVDLEYGAITKAINDYVGRYVIDPRISEINYNLTTPKLSDANATNNLKNVLTAAVNEVATPKGTVKVDNRAIADEKVTLKFELSVEETVYLDEDNSQSQKNQQTGASKPKAAPTTPSKTAQICSKPVRETVIQSADKKLYLQNSQSSQLYWQNAPSGISGPNKKNGITAEGVVDTIGAIGSGISDGAGSTEHIEKYAYVKVGDNGKVYTNPHARGNQYYKIVGNFSDNKIVKRAGFVGQVVSYGADVTKWGMKMSETHSDRERAEVTGGAIGKVASGFAAGTAATAATSAVLTTIAVAAGWAAAPVTIILIAGAAIVVGGVASNFAEKYGEELGGKAGVAAYDNWQDVTR